MSRTRIKICGITSPEDARLAAQLGADAIGLVFYPQSPRFVTLEQAAACAMAVPPFVTVVGLFVNATAAHIQSVLEAVSINVIQFHGDESEQFCASFNRPYVKALRVKPALDTLTSAAEFPSASGILLDAWHADAPGGTGMSFDWQQAQGAFSRPLILAGGLNDENVAVAVQRVRPAAVDVSSGVESMPGVKDRTKLKQFIAAVQSADQHHDGDQNDE